MPLVVRRDYSVPEARRILERYRKDLKSVREVKNEIERQLGWRPHGQTIWRHLKEMERERVLQMDSDMQMDVVGSIEMVRPELTAVDDIDGTMAEDEAVDVDGDVGEPSSDEPPLGGDRESPPKLAVQINIKREPSVESVPLRKVRSKRLTMSSIAVTEKDGSGVRVYRLNARSKNGKTVYYRCSYCDTLWRKMKENAEEGEELHRRWLPNIKTIEGEIIGDPYPEHHPDCLPMDPKAQQALEIDRSCRVSVKQGILPPRQAWNLGRRLATEKSDPCFGSSGTDEVPFPDWKSVSRKYRELDRKRRRLHNDQSNVFENPLDINLTSEELRYVNEELPGPMSDSEMTPVYPVRSKRLTLSSVVVPEESGEMVRVYRFNRRSADGKTFYYRCSRCDTLCNNARKVGLYEDESHVRAVLKTVDGRIVGNAHPEHHPLCRPMAARILKAQEIDKGCRIRVKEGVLSPRQAWDLGHQLALEEASMNLEGEQETVPFPDWSKVKRQYNELGRSKKEEHVDCTEQIVYDEDSMDIGSTECVTMTPSMEELYEAPHCCDCRQFYEANMALHEDVVRCLEDMRALRDEMRDMLADSRHNDLQRHHHYNDDVE